MSKRKRPNESVDALLSCVMGCDVFRLCVCVANTFRAFVDDISTAVDHINFDFENENCFTVQMMQLALAGSSMDFWMFISTKHILLLILVDTK